MRTFLLVADDLEQVLDRLTTPVTVVQHLPPRLAVVTAGDAVLPELLGSPDVLGIGDPELPADLYRDLTETERLFADAWVEGRRPKVRPGDGLAWDAPGFTPPDPPPRGGRGP